MTAHSKIIYFSLYFSHSGNLDIYDPSEQFNDTNDTEMEMYNNDEFSNAVYLIESETEISDVPPSSSKRTQIRSLDTPSTKKLNQKAKPAQLSKRPAESSIDELLIKHLKKEPDQNQYFLNDLGLLLATLPELVRYQTQIDIKQFVINKLKEVEEIE